MNREITVDEVEKILNEEITNDIIIIKRENKEDLILMNANQYRVMLEENLTKKLKRAEYQIENEEYLDSKIVFAEMGEKYEY